MMVRPTPASGFSCIARRFGRHRVTPLRWIIICQSALCLSSVFDSHLSQRNQSLLGETSIGSS
ncbi:hypothetical protein PR202_ga20885 [Eleusine coracana subsp. coracana]|uniref:Uncharacterized protein n=1 Tax=Eleusine coracana subsp. coracana TaxID=191504 RepID=A0AAV5CZD3_ELECO|nr:hypothetical protein PR202_ga20885 [Eleusine coracana subsp. coracana]